jgi:hypothetical protein
VTSDATDSDAAGIESGVATRVAQSGRNFGRASERCVSKRPQCGEQGMTRAVGPATGRVTTCHGDHGRHGACHIQHRVMAPGHGGHGAGHGIHGAGHSDHGDGEWPAGPESTTASAAGAALSPWWAGGTKAEHRLVDSALPDVVRSAMLRPIYICYIRCESHVPISRLGTHSGMLAQQDSVSESLPGPSLASACAALPALP